MTTPHECEFEEVPSGLEVVLDIELIRQLCPQADERKLRELFQQHAVPIAAHMVSAGIAAAVKLLNTAGESS